ncbi:archaeosortase/exosortase family protein [Aquabacterium sp.]|uniref:archaeosortase/exosortase family protein n=1 Tax=Aquabacterium sp. TaxID=1872578 RepID=UPI0025C3F008|nr:archaeosortase/exosortase family protein [Aquabacterium sp.]
MALLFTLVFLSLQWIWNTAKGSAFEYVVIDKATVGTVVRIINALTPDAHATADGSSIRSPGGGINVLNGCEGTEVLFLLMAAVIAYPLTWRLRAVGLLGGTAFVFIINQARLLALFYSYRSDRALFGQLHGVIAPLALIMVTLIFFVLLIRLNDRSAQKPRLV